LPQDAGKTQQYSSDSQQEQLTRRTPSAVLVKMRRVASAPVVLTVAMTYPQSSVAVHATTPFVIVKTCIAVESGGVGKMRVMSVPSGVYLTS
jgi:hypothetical protein